MKMEQNLSRFGRLPSEEGSAMHKIDERLAAPDGPASGDGGAHNRGDHRQRTLKAARVLLSDDFSTIDCAIRDISKGGARLVFGDAFSLPQEFRLLLVSSNTIVPAKLLWQRAKQAGVAFTGPEEPAHARK
jgi:hypothetical protein